MQTRKINNPPSNSAVRRLSFGFGSLHHREPLSFPPNCRWLAPAGRNPVPGGHVLRSGRGLLYAHRLHTLQTSFPWCFSRRGGVRLWQATQEGRRGCDAPRISSQRFDSLPEDDPPVCNQGLISQLTASSSIISIQTN